MIINNEMRSNTLAVELTTAGVQLMQIEFFGDNDDHFSICVPHIDEICKIYEIIFQDDASNYDDSLFVRVLHEHNGEDSWDYALSPCHTDWGQKILKEVGGDKMQSFDTASNIDDTPFQFTAYVIIPESDYDEVLRRVKAYIK